MALSGIASDQSKATISIKNLSKQLLDYLATNPDMTIRYYTSDMILTIHLDTLYLSVKNEKSRAAGDIFSLAKQQKTENQYD